MSEILWVTQEKKDTDDRKPYTYPGANWWVGQSLNMFNIWNIMSYSRKKGHRLPHTLYIFWGQVMGRFCQSISRSKSEHVYYPKYNELLKKDEGTEVNANHIHI